MKERSIPFFSIIILLLTNSILINLPITNSLGYEFAVVNAILLFIIAGFQVIRFFKKNHDINPIYFFIKRRLVITIFLVVPLLIGFVSHLMQSRCPFKDGIEFYFVVTVLAFFLGLCAGYFSINVSRRFANTIFIVITLLILLSTLLEFYINPQVYFYNPIFGYFPGTIYDEDVAVNSKLMAFQAFHVLVGIAFVSTLYLSQQRGKSIRIIVLVLSTGISILFFILKPVFGFATDGTRLIGSLKNSISSEHFEIYFGDSVKIEDRKYAVLLHEYYYERILDQLKEKYDKKIKSFIFDDKMQKRELFGSANANVAKPWMNQIYLNSTNYEGSLKHELVHVVASRFGVTPFRVAENFNTAMIEGMAMMIENDFDGTSIYYAAKLAYNNGYKINLQKLFEGLGFFSSFSSISYIYSGAFLLFLSDNYGVDKVKKLYRDLDFNKYFGKEFPALIKEFENFLSKNSVTNRNKAQLYFGGQTIFKKFCPRMAANEIKIARNYYNKKNFEEAEKVFDKIYQYSGSYSSLGGKVASLNRQKKYESSIKLLLTELPKFNKSQFYFNLELGLADTYVLLGDSINAIRWYDSLITQKAHIEFEEEVLIRKELLKRSTNKLRSYLEGKPEKKFNELMELNTAQLCYFSIPTISLYGKKYSEMLDAFLNSIKDKFMVSDLHSGNAALSISNYYAKLGKFREAKFWAVKATDFKVDENYMHRSIENLRLVNWLYNFADETEKSFKYN